VSVKKLQYSDVLTLGREQEIEKTLARINILIGLDMKTPEIDQILLIVDKMPPLMNEIITRAYLDANSAYTTHSQIYRDLKLSPSTYLKLRTRGLYKIGFAIGVLVPIK
jgi:hypothetical protein